MECPDHGGDVQEEGRIHEIEPEASVIVGRKRKESIADKAHFGTTMVQSGDGCQISYRSSLSSRRPHVRNACFIFICLFHDQINYPHNFLHHGRFGQFLCKK